MTPYPAHRHPVAEQLRHPEVIADGVRTAQPVDVGVQPGEVGGADDGVVGVHDPDVVAVALGEGECFGSVVAEVAPGPFVKFAGDAEAGHVGADQVLGAVVGAGVHDHPGADVGRDGVEYLGDDVCLVAHDHVQADRGPCGHWVGHGQILSSSHKAARGDLANVACARLNRGDAEHLVEGGDV